MQALQGPGLIQRAQREDPHWFGGRIPDRPLSVEFVTIGQQDGYQRFSGAGLTKEKVSVLQRTDFLTGLTPAWLP